MGATSRRSGADGERMVAHLFRKWGYPAERGVQHDGRTGHADVEGVPYIHIEVKFYARFTPGDLEKAMLQSERDASGRQEATGEYLIPIVVHKVKGAHGWSVSMRCLSLFALHEAMPYTTDDPCGEIVTMAFDDFIVVYMAYEGRRHD